MKRSIFLISSVVATIGLATIADPLAVAAAPLRNGKIAFTQIVEGNDAPSAFTIDADGSDQAMVGPEGSVECTAWSPDGHTILCNDQSPPKVQPATADPDGSNFADLDPSLPLDLFCTFWSPSGERILCHSEGKPRPDDAGLYTIGSAGGGSRRRVTTSPKGTSDQPFGYSPDGSHILFARFRSDKKPGVLFSVTRNGQDLIQLSSQRIGVIDFFSDRLGASWSPDGSKVAFSGQKPNGHTALFVANADGTHLRRICREGRGALSAQWSPDGNRIAFTSYYGAAVIRANGREFKVILPSNRDTFTRSPVWSPDGRELLALRNFGGVRSLWTATKRGTRRSKVIATEIPLEYDWGAAP